MSIDEFENSVSNECDKDENLVKSDDELHPLIKDLQKIKIASQSNRSNLAMNTNEMSQEQNQVRWILYPNLVLFSFMRMK